MAYTLELDDAASASGIAWTIGDTVGRFRILGRLGQGGMGIVYEAFDPDLDRVVAIKVLERGTHLRLVAEAKAMARLDHANVVAVHEIGSSKGQLFVVMDLVRGVTLSTWLESARTWRAIVHMFAQAGEGLVAAHRAGLVHGDFKPSNVLVDDHGRARVADFGIAVAVDDFDEPRALGGTPGYTAPETGATVRADQFSFAVSLAEALGGRGPRRIHRALDRATTRDPSQRFPELRNLLDELHLAMSRTRGRVLLGAGLALTVIAGMIATRGSTKPDVCVASAKLIDVVWPTRGVRTAGAPLIDGWASSWRFARTSACALPIEQRVARLACLDLRLAELRAQLEVWRAADPEVLRHAVSSAASLPTPESCTSTSSVPGPALVERIAVAEAQLRSGTIAQHRDHLADLVRDALASSDEATIASALLPVAQSELELGAFDDADTHASRCAIASTKVGDIDRTLSSTIVRARVAVSRGRPNDAVGMLDATMALVRDDLQRERMLAARGSALLHAGRTREAIEDDRAAVALADIVVARDRQARLAQMLAVRELAHGLATNHAYADSLALGQRTLALTTDLYGADHPEVGKVLIDLADNEGWLGRYDDALVHLEHARALFVAAYGEHHRLVALVAYSTGGLELKRGRLPHAIAAFQRSLDAMPDDAPDRRNVEHALANALRMSGDDKAARPHFERAFEISTKVAPEGFEYGNYEVHLAACLINLHELQSAREHLMHALAVFDTAGVADTDRAEALGDLAVVEWGLDHRIAAKQLVRRVLDITSHGGELYRPIEIEMKRLTAMWHVTGSSRR